MIHFFPTFSKKAGDSPFGKELKNLGIDYRVFAGEVIFRYQNRIWLAFFGWPKLALFALRSAIRSLVASKPYPDVVVLGSHIEVIVFGLIRGILFKNKPAFLLLGFIFTERANPIINSFRKRYLSFIFKLCDKIIVHSEHEAERYKKLFSGSQSRFVSIPYGMHIASRWLDSPNSLHSPPPPAPYILSVGRSGRDYKTLIAAVSETDWDLHIICDSGTPLDGIEIPSNVAVLRSCYGDDYMRELRFATCVAIPLSANDISAGQMVLIQAMAFEKPTVITRTPTVEEYVNDGQDAILVAQKDVKAMTSALRSLLENHQLAEALGKNGRNAYEAKYCIRAFTENLVREANTLIKESHFAKK